jgi:hypothetical protein
VKGTSHVPSYRGAVRWSIRKLMSAVVLTVAIVAGGCNSDSSETERPRRASDNCFALGWKECKDEPYPFDTDPPPVVPTAVDGTYTRTISKRLAWAPGKCRRCPPYRLEPGREILEFDSGRFFVTHYPPGFKSSGHFIVSEGQIVLLNDANCLGFEGIYDWRLEDGVLFLDAVEDECPYTRLRQRFMMAKPWTVSKG